MKIKEGLDKRLRLNDRFNIELFNSIEEVKDFWSNVTINEDVFLTVEYFRSIESCSIEGLEQKYALLYQGGNVIAYFPMQISQFQAEDSIKDVEDKDSSKLRKSIAKCIKIDGLVGGNMIVSGEYMFRFLVDGFSPKDKFEILDEVLSFCKQYYQSRERTLSVVFTKDIPVARKLESIGITKSKFSSFTVEPLMVFHIDESWEHFSDYMGALSSKYRVRAKRAFKKSAHLTSRELSLEEIENKVEEYFPLYMEVFEGLNFSLFKLPKDYFISLKRHLGDRFHFYVLEDSEKRIKGFYTLIHNNKELHAHFLGYDKQVNKECQLYLTMLYKMISYGIEHRFKLIDFGRTALEIKSSVGAIPHHYELYAKHTNSIANFFIGPVINILNKKTSWEPRHPYRK